MRNVLANSLGMATEPPSDPQPPIDKESPIPVDYVRIWVEQFGDFTKGNIEKSRIMSRDQLTKEDAEFLIGYGITQSQIAIQYQIPTGSLTAIFKKLGVKTQPAKLSREEFRQRVQTSKTERSGDSSTVAPTPIPEKVQAEEQCAEEIWFTCPSLTNTDPRPLVTVRQEYISFNSAFTDNIGTTDYVYFCAVSDGCIKIKCAMDGIKLHRGSSKSMRRCCCSQFKKHLDLNGVKFPAVYMMKQLEVGLWRGEPI